MINELENDRDSGPWYKQFWAWFVITPLIVIVCACAVLLTVAYSMNTDIVNDSFYKKGRMLDTSFDATQYAIELGIEGHLFYDQTNNSLLLGLYSNESVYAPEISFELSHPFEKEQDIKLAMQLIENGVANEIIQQALIKTTKPFQYFYSVSLTEAITGKRYLRASYFTSLKKNKINRQALEVWRISGEAILNENMTGELLP